MHRFIVLSVLAAFVGGCTAHHRGETGDEGGRSFCRGTYTCSGSDGDFDVEADWRDGACDFGGIALAPDGTASAPGLSDVTWYRDGAELGICVSDGCLVCATQESSGSGGSAGHCAGYASSCPSYPPCAHVPGCYAGYEYCEGSAYSCSSWATPDGCSSQPGCFWER